MTTIETTVDFHASPEEVWVTLMDFDAYPEWNPFVTEISGRPLEGERLRVRIEPPESRAMTFKPRVTEMVPGERLEWLGKLLVPGLFDGRHSFRVEEVGPGHTRLYHSEEFSGVLVGFFLDEEATRSGFEAMNQALKERVERTAASQSVGQAA